MHCSPLVTYIPHCSNLRGNSLGAKLQSWQQQQASCTLPAPPMLLPPAHSMLTPHTAPAPRPTSACSSSISADASEAGIATTLA